MTALTKTEKVQLSQELLDEFLGGNYTLHGPMDESEGVNIQEIRYLPAHADAAKSLGSGTLLITTRLVEREGEKVFDRPSIRRLSVEEDSQISLTLLWSECQWDDDAHETLKIQLFQAGTLWITKP